MFLSQERRRGREIYSEETLVSFIFKTVSKCLSREITKESAEKDEVKNTPIGFIADPGVGWILVLSAWAVCMVDAIKMLLPPVDRDASVWELGRPETRLAAGSQRCHGVSSRRQQVAYRLNSHPRRYAGA